MSILEIIIIIVVIGVVLWLVNTYIPMAAPIKTVLNIVVLIVIVLWILSLFFPGLGKIGVR